MFILQKNHPELNIVKDSYYCHAAVNQKFKTLYFEIEKKYHATISIEERNNLKRELEQDIISSIQKLAPLVFMRRNEEEVYKKILTLSREITSLNDLPQAWIFPN